MNIVHAQESGKVYYEITSRDAMENEWTTQYSTGKYSNIS